MTMLLNETLQERYGLFSKQNDIEENNYTFVSSKKENEDLIIVFMLGESSRGDHWSLNGYQRETNPRLQQIKNVVNFQNAHSCRLSTNLSFACIITGHNETANYAYYPKKENMFSFFKKAGYHVSFFSTGTNDLSEFFKHDIKGMTIKINKATFSNDYNYTYDIDLKEMLQSVLLKYPKHPHFIVMSTRGSHHNYEKRVPEEFEIFHSADKGPIINSKAAYCNLHNNGLHLNDLVDAYDATILYTDYVIAELIKELQDKNALLLYASDHGESFGERGQPCLHGYNSPEVWHVPFLIWASDKYIHNNPEKWHNLLQASKDANQKNAKRMVSHDNIIHSLLDAASIETEFTDKSMSLFNGDEPFNPNIFEGCNRFKNKHSACADFE